MKKNILLVFAISVVFLTFNACQDRSDLTAPAINDGSADFSRLVSIGNSLTMGIQSNSCWQSAQQYSIGNQFAKQVGNVTYAQPYVSDPGLGQRIEIQSLMTYPPTLAYNTNMGVPLNSSYEAPYNNLGISGAILYDIMDSTDLATKTIKRQNPYFQLVLRDQTKFGSSIYAQAKNLKPTFILLDIGNNDALGYGLSGGTSGPDATGKLPTDQNVFAALYSQLAAAIKADMPSTKVAIANIPDINSIPYFTTVGPLIALELAIANVDLYYQKTNETGIASGKTRLTSANDVLITLPGVVYATLIGKATGQFYRDNGYTALPAGIDTTKPFGVDPRNPWPNALVLDLDEQAILANAIASFNKTIAGIVSANSNFVLVDVNSLFNTLKLGYTANGLLFNSSYITGRLFSLDGVHPTSQGYAVFTNEFIRSINAKFGANISLINVATVPGSLTLSKTGYPEIPYRFQAVAGTFRNIQY